MLPGQWLIQCSRLRSSTGADEPHRVISKVAARRKWTYVRI